MVHQRRATPQTIASSARDFEGHLRVDGAVGAAPSSNDGRSLRRAHGLRSAHLGAGLARACSRRRPRIRWRRRWRWGCSRARRRHWRSTQETAWSLLALDDYRKAQEKTAPSFDVRAFIGSTEILSGAFHGRTTRALSASVSAAKVLSSGGKSAFELKGTGAPVLRGAAALRHQRATGEFARSRILRQKGHDGVKPEELAKLTSAVPTRSRRRSPGATWS